MEELIIPNHVAIIVDGNGRWAVQRGKKRSEGHREGMKRLEEISKYAFQKGVKVLSLYVFSTENFKREKEEVSYLMSLFKTNLQRFSATFGKENVRIVFSGREYPLDKTLLTVMQKIEKETQDKTKAILNICINYGGHAEIIDACKKIAKDVKEGKMQIEQIDESSFSASLYQKLPPVDFLIRTSGEERISNFLLWQLAYAEFYFPKILFPDFDKKEFDQAILVYNKRDRRFGGIKNENKNY